MERLFKRLSFFEEVGQVRNQDVIMRRFGGACRCQRGRGLQTTILALGAVCGSEKGTEDADGIIADKGSAGRASGSVRQGVCNRLRLLRDDGRRGDAAAVERGQ